MAKDSEILNLESKIDELQATLKSFQKKPLEKVSSGVQTTEKPIEPEALFDLQSQNLEMAKRIEALEKNLFSSELKCIELNQLIKNCYNDVEMFGENKEKRTNMEQFRNKHRIMSVIEKEVPDRYRSNSEEKDLVRRKSPPALSLINLINYKSRLTAHSKTPTQKHSINAFNFGSAIKKKLTSPKY